MTTTYPLQVTVQQLAATIQQMSPSDRAALLALLNGPAVSGPPQPPTTAGRETAKLLPVNGINGLDGQPLAGASTEDDVLAWIEDEESGKSALQQGRLLTLHHRFQQAKGQGMRGCIQGIDALNPKEAGWGVVFHPNTPAAVRSALQPLIDHRQAQCQRAQVIYEIDLAVDCDPQGQLEAFEFRHRHGQAHGAVNPAHLPYYLLLVGPPTDISYRFQYGLDAQHAVGRLHFDDPDGYARYVDALLKYEGARTPQPQPRQRRLVFFAPDSDEATQLSAQYLAQRLADLLEDKALSPAANKSVAYSYKTALLRQDAFKPKLLELLQQDSATLLFTASHGIGFPSSSTALQMAAQGGIVCQEWPGAEHWNHLQPVPPEMYVAGQDVHDLPAAAQLDGLIVFAFGCYTAGTPGESDFHHLYSHIPPEAAAQPFVARLPQELLRRGALAFVGHVDRAWPYSFGWPGVGAQTDTFQSGLEALLVGEPIGRALEHFQEKYLDLNNTLTDQQLLYNYQMELAGGERLIPIWTARNDARAYVLLGDPLVRLYPERLAAPG